MLSVLMTVYEKEDAAYFRESLQSIQAQTFQADEVIVVADGQLNDALEEVIRDSSRALPLIVVSLPKYGRCKALRAGVEACSGETVAIMDSDDICLPYRFELQARTMRSHPEIDVLGSAIAEFDHDPELPLSIRRMPTSHTRIANYAKYRNPMNQVSVMFRRDAVLRAGNYQPAPGFEDWHLWNRMIQAGSRLMNLDEVLVQVRVGNGMFRRRSGLQYARHEISFHRKMYQSKFLSSGELLRSLLLRVPLRFAPEIVLRTLYMKALRSEL
jgi:O104-antigen biosynthesis beta-1,3-galactosyltransferase